MTEEVVLFVLSEDEKSEIERLFGYVLDPEPLSQLLDYVDEVLDKRLNHMVSAINHGAAGYDLMPTMSSSGRDTFWWYNYLQGLDTMWRIRMVQAVFDGK